MEVVDAAGHRPADICRKGVGCRVAVVPRRLNTSSTRRFGPTYSMFILRGDLRSEGSFMCTRCL